MSSRNKDKNDDAKEGAVEAEAKNSESPPSKSSTATLNNTGKNTSETAETPTISIQQAHCHKRRRVCQTGRFFLPCHLAMLQSLYPKNDKNADENDGLWNMIQEFLQQRSDLGSCRDDCFHRELLHQEAKEWANTFATARRPHTHGPKRVESPRLSTASSSSVSFSLSLSSSTTSSSSSSWNLVCALLRKKHEASQSKAARALEPFACLHRQVRHRLDELKMELESAVRSYEEDNWHRRFRQGQFLNDTDRRTGHSMALDNYKVTLESKIALWGLLLESVPCTTIT